MAWRKWYSLLCFSCLQENYSSYLHNTLTALNSLQLSLLLLWHIGCITLHLGFYSSFLKQTLVKIMLLLLSLSLVGCSYHLSNLTDPSEALKLNFPSRIPVLVIFTLIPVLLNGADIIFANQSIAFHWCPVLYVLLPIPIYSNLCSFSQIYNISHILC